MFKAAELVAFVLSMLGMPYWYGTYVNKCTEDRRAKKAKQYPKHYGSSRTAKYRKHIAAKLISMDCVGMIKGFFWTNGGQGVAAAIGNDKTYTMKYESNGCPDKSADGMLAWCKKQGAKNGPISTMPDVPGILLFSPGHVGVYIGGGYAVEARGFDHGVVKTKVSSRGWKNWAYLPSSLLAYDNTPIESNPPTNPPAGESKPTLRKGDKGAAVKTLQAALNDFGFSLNVDGDFGSKTDAAVRGFQKANGLTVDGICGTKTWAKLEEANAAEAGIGVGSIVEISSAAKNYYPGSGLIPDWAKKDYYHVVAQITSSGKAVVKGGETCVLLGEKINKKTGVREKGINTWVAVNALTVKKVNA